MDRSIINNSSFNKNIAFVIASYQPNKDASDLLRTAIVSILNTINENVSLWVIDIGSPDGKYLVSSFIKNNNKPVIGDILVTSGNANIYPAGVLVGKIIKINHDKIFAIPFVDLKNIEFVQIIKNN